MYLYRSLGGNRASFGLEGTRRGARSPSIRIDGVVVRYEQILLLVITICMCIFIYSRSNSFFNMASTYMSCKW